MHEHMTVPDPPSHPYLPLLRGDHEFQKGHLLSPGIDLREVIESGGQWAVGPLDVLPLLHQMLEHL